MHLYEFFKEGNRLKIDLLVTDNPLAPIAATFKAEGIEVAEILPNTTGAELTDRLRRQGVELLVVDDFSPALPEELREAYGEAIVYPTTPQSAPLDVIVAIDKINAAKKPHIEQPPAPQPSTGTAPVFSEGEKEWAQELDIKAEETAPEGVEQSPTPQPEQQPQPPRYETSHGQQPPQQPGYQGYGQQPQSGYPNYQESAPLPEPMPNTYLVWSVIITILCCLIPGIIAIIYSASVSSKYYRGDIEGAKRASRNAEIWCIVSIVAGIVWSTFYIPLSLFVQ